MGEERRQQEDRRDAERYRCRDVLLVYEQEGGLLSGFFKGKQKASKPVPVRNICRDGLCFLSKEDFPVGRKLRMVVHFGHRKPTIRLSGQVQWTDEGEGRYPYRIGVALTDVGPRAWEVLGRLSQLCYTEEDWKRWRLRSKERASRAFGEDSRFDGPSGD